MGLLACGLVSCGGGSHVAYRPVAFGENGQCYYVNDPGEISILQSQGLCEPSWVPVLMPDYWHYRYYNYYSSPLYIDTYVPAYARSTVIGRERDYGANHQTQINAEAPKATYKGSNGQVVTADKIGATKYGGGSRFGPPGVKFGGGSGRSNPNSNTNNNTRTGGGGGSGGRKGR